MFHNLIIRKVGSSHDEPYETVHSSLILVNAGSPLRGVSCKASHLHGSSHLHGDGLRAERLPGLPREGTVDAAGDGAWDGMLLNDMPFSSFGGLSHHLSALSQEAAPSGD